MKKIVFLLVVVLTLALSAPVFANLDDTRATIAQRYGDYGRVLDTDNQPWTKEQWEKSGHKKAKADTYIYNFGRQGNGIWMDVKYEGDKPGSFVQMQRFTPNNPFQIKDFQKMFPELYPLVSSTHTVVFATYKELTTNLTEKNSPVTLGVAVKTDLGGNRKGYFTLLAFNVQDEGRFVKDPKHIDENTYIREFTIERTYLAILKDNLTGDWKEIKNFFDPTAKPIASPNKPGKKPAKR